MNSPFLNRLKSPERPVLVFDGAMGTSLQTQNLTAEDFGGAEYEGEDVSAWISMPTF